MSNPYLVPGRKIRFIYSGSKIQGEVVKIISGHVFIRLGEDYISNSGKQHYEGEKQMFIQKSMTDLKLC